MSWDDVGNALVAGVKAAANLPDSRVIWKQQNYNAPPHSYITLAMPSILEKGQDWIEENTDITRPRGQEVEIRVKGIREVPLELELFTDEGVAGGGHSAIVKMVDLTARFKLPSVREIFSAQGISLFDVGKINWIPDVPGTTFRGRAVCTIRMYLPLPSVAEYVGFIERVIGSFVSEGAQTIETPFDTAASAMVAPGTEDTGAPVTIVSFALAPASYTTSLPLDQKRLVATVVMSTGDTYDASLLTSWSSSDPNLALVDDTGLVTVIGGPGSTTITATYLGATATAIVTRT